MFLLPSVSPGLQGGGRKDGRTKDGKTERREDGKTEVVVAAYMRPPRPRGTREFVPAASEAIPRRGEASPAASAASSRQLAQRALGGRRVYLFTGHERATTRREMGKALEQYGAICEVFDGNRRNNLGPELRP